MSIILSGGNLMTNAESSDDPKTFNSETQLISEIDNKIPIYRSLSENSKFSDKCTCDINKVVGYICALTTAELCINNSQPEDGHMEAFAEVEINCNGPKGNLFRIHKRCNPEVKVHISTIQI